MPTPREIDDMIEELRVSVHLAYRVPGNIGSEIKRHFGSSAEVLAVCIDLYSKLKHIGQARLDAAIEAVEQAAKSEPNLKLSGEPDDDDSSSSSTSDRSGNAGD